MDNLNKEDKSRHPSTIKLVELLENMMNRSLVFLDTDEFIEIYKALFKTPLKNIDGLGRPPLAGSSVEAKKTRDILHDIVKRIVKEEIDVFLEESEVDDKFRKLESLRLECQQLPPGKEAWRPPGDAKQHLKPFMLGLKVQEKNELIRHVNDEREKLELVKARVRDMRKQATAMDESVSRKMDQLMESLKEIN